MIQQQAFVSGEKFQNVQLPHTIRQITIQPKKNSNIRSTNRIYYHYDIKILNTDAVKIEDLTMTSWDVQESNFVLESVECISLERVSFKVRNVYWWNRCHVVIPSFATNFFNII